MPTYTYNNGNFSSTTNIVNGIAYTQNVMMLGSTGSGCGDSPCPQGYSLYFPCLKTITRGEDVCFDFYVVNNVTKDVVDLRTVDALSITLTGSFGCSLGTYTYPSDDNYIRPLQSQEYKSILDERFTERQKFNLNVFSVDTDIEEIQEANIRGKVGLYYEGDVAELEAYDTESYFFVGWIDIDSDLDEECDDFFFSVERRIFVTMDGDKNIAAVYRKKKKFTITADEYNSLFTYYKDGEEIPFKDGLVVNEGNYIVVRALPINSIFSSWDTRYLNGCEHTDVNNIVMEIKVESDIRLKINTMDVDESDSSDDGSENYLFDLNFVGFSFSRLISLCNIELHSNKIVQHYIRTNILTDDLVFSKDTDISKYFTSIEPIEYNNIYPYHRGMNTFIKFGNDEENGYLEFGNPKAEQETVVEVHCLKYNDTDCSICVEIDGDQQVQELYSDTNILIFKFDKTDFKSIKVSSLGQVFPEETSGCCLVDRIIVSDVVIIDKGKATLCLPGSVTSTFHRGKITATGAIMVGGQTFGLPCTQVGTVSGNPIIRQQIII